MSVEPEPRISVLLPVRDAGALLEECLDSLSAQSLQEFEVVAVDDGSADGSGERLLARARLDPRLRVLRTGQARGLVPALQLALAEARAPLVARMDADDVAHPERLALQLARLEAKPAVDVLGCRVSACAAVAGEPVGEGMRLYVKWSNTLLDHDSMERQRFVESPLVHPSVAMRRETLLSLGWRAFDGPEDYDLWLRAFEAGLRFEKLPQVLLDWRDSKTRLTRRDARYSLARFQELKLEVLLRGPLAERGAVLWGAGPIGKSWARSLVEAGRPARAFVEVNPRQIGRRIQGAPVVGLRDVPALHGAVHLGCVGQRGARERIRAEAQRLGLREGQDFYAVA